MKRKHIVIGAVAVFVILAAIGGASNSGTVAADPVATPAPVANESVYGARMTDEVNPSIRDYGLTESFTMDPGSYRFTGADEFCLDGTAGNAADEAWATAHGADDSYCITVTETTRIVITESDAGRNFYIIGAPSTLVTAYKGA